MQLVYPTQIRATTRRLLFKKRLQAYASLFDASKASHILVTLQLPKVTITWTVNAYA